MEEEESHDSITNVAELSFQIVQLISEIGIQDEQIIQNLYHTMAVTILKQLEGGEDSGEVLNSHLDNESLQ